MQRDLEKEEAVKTICRKLIVDDWLKSVDIEDQMVQLANSIRISKRMVVTKYKNWLSNSKRVIFSLNDIYKALSKYVGSQDELPEKVLGMWRLPESDILTFVIRPELLQKLALIPNAKC